MDASRASAGSARAHPRRTLPLGRGLFLQVAAVVLFLYAVLTASAVFHNRYTVAALSRGLMHQAGELAEARLTQFFRPAAEVAALLSEEILVGALLPEDPAAFSQRVLPLLRVTPVLHGAGLARPDGAMVFLSRDTNGWLERHRLAGGPEQPSSFRRMSAAGSESARWQEHDGYNTVSRPWFRVAAGAEPLTELVAARGAEPLVVLTPPYAFARETGQGVTAVRRVRLPTGDELVLAVDVTLADLADFLDDIRPGRRGVALLVDEQGRLLGLPKYAGGQGYEVGIEEWLEQLGLPPQVRRDLLAVWGEVRQAGVERQRRLGGREPFWLGFRPFPVGTQRLWLFVAIPEVELSGPLRRRDRQVLGSLAAALLVGLTLALAVARRTARPLAALAEEAERAGRLDLSPGPPAPSAWREIAALAEAQRRMRTALGSFASYVPVELVRQLLRRGEAAQLGGHPETLTVLFTDLENFTGYAEALPAAQVAEELSAYLSVLVGALQEHGATIDKFIGDSVLAFWGAPEPVVDHARRAVQAVLAAEDRLRALNAARVASGRPALVTRYGLATGTVVVGNFGTPARMNYTVLGNVVNVASRLERLNKRFGSRILATGEVRAAAGEGFAWQRLGPVLVKGKTLTVEVVELLGRTEEVPAPRQDFARRCEAVLAGLEAGSASAAAELEALAAAAPGDPHVTFLGEFLRRGGTATGTLSPPLPAPPPPSPVPRPRQPQAGLHQPAVSVRPPAS